MGYVSRICFTCVLIVGYTCCCLLACMLVGFLFKFIQIWQVCGNEIRVTSKTKLAFLMSCDTRGFHCDWLQHTLGTLCTVGDSHSPDTLTHTFT